MLGSWFTKTALFFLGKFSLEKATEMAFEFGERKLVEWVKEEHLDDDTKMYIQNIYQVANTLGRRWVRMSEFTNIDNQFVDSVVNACEGLSRKHNFPLPALVHRASNVTGHRVATPTGRKR